MKSNRAPVLLLLAAAFASAVALIGLRLHFQPPTVPEYVSDTASEELLLARASLLDLRLRPVAPVRGAIGARAFLMRDNEVRPWDPPFSVTQDGAVRITGAVATILAGVPAGPWEIAVAVGRPEVLPTAPSDLVRERERPARRRAGWRLVRQRIRIDG
jgi:hypothetical protein